MSAQTTAQAQEHGHDDEPHVLPLRVYLGVWGALMVFTVITVTVAQFDFGSWNTLVALLIATIKASLVAMYFMHLRYDNKFNVIVLLAGLLFVSIFFTPTLIDITTRGAIDPLRAEPIGATRYRQAPPPPAGAAPHGESPHH